MTPVTRQSSSSSIHIASHTTRYDYLNAAKKNLGNDDNDKQQQSYDQECFDGGDDACVSISTRKTRNSKLKQQQQQQKQQQEQQQITAKKIKTVAFANQEQAPVQEQQQQPKGKMLSKRQRRMLSKRLSAALR